MKSKTIWHVGGYNRNYGDFVLLESIRENLEKQSDIPLNFVNIDCQSTHFFKELIDELNEKADMLIIGGGGFIMNRHEDNSLSGWQWSIKNEDITKIKVPIIVYGIGYNRFNYDNREFKEQMNESLLITQKCSELFSVRNNGTKRELIRRGLNKNKIQVIPDSGMFISPKKIDASFLNTSRMLIGLNFVCDRPQYTYPGNYNETKKEIMHNLIEFCKYCIKKYNALFINIDHIPELDIETNELFKKELKDNYVVLSEVLPYIYPPSLVNSHFLAYIYKKMNYVIGMRGHSNIISYGVGTPFISFGSHNKNRFFTKDIDEEKYLIDISKYPDSTKVDNIIYVFEKLINDKNYQKRNLKKKEKFEKAFSEFNKNIIKILKSTEKKEMLDLYDDNFEKLYEVIERGTNTDVGKNIMLSVAFIKNNDKYLIQKTSRLKGSKYSTTGGHIIHDENPVEAIIREIKEELGINVTNKDLKLITTFKYPIKNCIFNVYYIDSLNIDVKNIKLQEAEVEKVAYLTKEEINKIINDGNFLESHAYIFKEYIDK